MEPRPAASVLVVRGTTPWQVLMMRRPGGADFAPGAHVFPGGSVHPEDAGSADQAAATAIRELFEELGILLARSGRGFAIDDDCARLRLRLQHGVSFLRALREARLEPAFDVLHHFARWVTPEVLRRRFDTRFYLTRLPAGQTVHPQPGEVDDWLWIEPREALARDDFMMVFATRGILEGIANEPDADRLFERVAALDEVQPVRPKVRQTDAGWVVDV